MRQLAGLGGAPRRAGYPYHDESMWCVARYQDPFLQPTAATTLYSFSSGRYGGHPPREIPKNLIRARGPWQDKVG